MSDLRLVVWDVDGTLVDSQAHILMAFGRAFDALGLPMPDRAAVLSIVGLSLPQAVAKLAGDQDAVTQEKLISLYKDGFQAIRAEGETSQLYPGALDTLQALHGHDEVLMGVATGKSKRGLDHLLDTLDLRRFFVTTQVADFHPSKPHPAMLQAALADAGVAPQDAVMIGDTSYDIDMGRTAGVPTIGVHWGFHPAVSLTQADHQATEFAQIPAILRGHWGI
ncbi:HAD family hydrolase [Actibacterium mucosum KCTC 23349]|uniref:HAD family hydrolase n=1 Tax=Actibacterium mucosum KCTC 23349 TaxID=1454373 RepID=A0A037ZF90_9RHOB|nr:HAD-IA family hydrolase [Actibacterium mucosum]KAJ54797.1 HAD family hydrolase [Actibacterium mucosum KCTC 23349]